MSGQGFDVFVVGAADNSPGGQQKLSATLSSHLGVASPAVAKGLAERKLRAGNNLDQAAAQAMVRDLKAMGAVTVVRPSAISLGMGAGASAAAGTPTPSPARGLAGYGAPAPPVPAVPAPPTLGGRGGDPSSPALFSALEPAPSSGAGPDPFAPPTPAAPGRGQSSPGTAAYNPFTAPTVPGLGAGLGAGPPSPPPSAFAPPPSAPGLSLATGAPPSRSVPPMAGGVPIAAPPEDAFSGSFPVDAPLELDTTKRSEDDGFQRAPGTVGGMSALIAVDKVLPATSSASSLAVNTEAAGDPHRLRCAKHGLLYDSRKASGCTKCLEPARKVAAKIRRNTEGFRLADYGEDSTRRAFVGLAIALLVGLIPAAYHAMRMGTRDIRRLRAEQEVLSRKPATDEVIARFDAIEGDLRRTKSRAMRNTAIIWVVVSGGTLVGWYRLT